MPKLKLVGGEKIQVSQKVADRILGMKENKNLPKDMLLDVGNKNFLEISQIKGILNDFEDAEIQIREQRSQDFMERLKDWQEYVKKVSAQNPEEKSKRMVKSGCYLLNVVRGYGQMIAGETKDKLMFELLPYFEKNNKKWWAGKEIYEQHIPRQEKDWGTSEGIKALGQMMYER